MLSVHSAVQTINVLRCEIWVNSRKAHQIELIDVMWLQVFHCQAGWTTTIQSVVFAK